MLANMSAYTAHRFQPFQPSSELVEKVDQPNQPIEREKIQPTKTVDPNRTRPKIETLITENNKK